MNRDILADGLTDGGSMHATYGFGLFKPLATDRLYLTEDEAEVYGLHANGTPISDIARMKLISESDVRDIITYVWRADSQMFMNMRRTAKSG